MLFPLIFSQIHKRCHAMVKNIKKLFVIVLMFASVAMILTGCSNSDNIEKKVRIVLVGNFISDDKAKQMIDYLQKKTNDKVYIDQILYTGKTPQSQQEFAFAQKLMIMLAAGEGDIYVLDKELFQSYAENGAFYSLSDFAKKNKLDNLIDDSCYIQSKDKKEKDLYGLKADNIKMLKDAGFLCKNKYLTIYVRSNKFERAKKVLLELINAK